MSQYYEGIGRRKEATARVRVSSGSGKFTVNEKEAPQYFTRLGDLNDIMLPLRAAGEEPAAYDITVLVKGGGVSGQTDAVKLGCARWSSLTPSGTRPCARAACSPAMPASGTQEARPQARPQGSHLHQALTPRDDAQAGWRPFRPHRRARGG
jgi:ribosomal protein S9